MGSRAQVRRLADRAHLSNSYTLTGHGTVVYRASATANDVYAQGPTLRIDPGGLARNLVLPVEGGSTGVRLRIVNTADAAEAITVRNSADDATVGTLDQNEEATVVCDGVAWSVAVDQTT